MSITIKDVAREANVSSIIVTADDTLVFGAIRALKENSIENVIMVVGFNNTLQVLYYRN